ISDDIESDLAAGFTALGLIERLFSLLSIYDDPTLSFQVVEILIALSRHSSSLANQVLKVGQIIHPLCFCLILFPPLFHSYSAGTESEAFCKALLRLYHDSALSRGPGLGRVSTIPAANGKD